MFVKVLFAESRWHLNSYFLVTIQPKSAFLHGSFFHCTFAVEFKIQPRDCSRSAIEASFIALA